MTSDELVDEQHEQSVRTFREVRVQAQQLIENLNGAVSRVTVRAGDCVVEVDCARPSASVDDVLALGDHDTVARDASIADGSSTDASVHRVTAPLVGTFYRAESPTAAPFVEVGDVVEPGQQIGIVEAMKLMNAINADVHARVAAINVEDGKMVEHDEPLFDLIPID